MTRAEERRAAVDAAVADIREIEKREGVTPAALEKIRDRLIALAERKELFTLEDFPPPEEGGERNSCLYRLSEDPDHRFALYLNMARPGVSSPAHDHTTWAAIVGIEGEEVNRVYAGKAEGGAPEEVRQAVVKHGTGVAFMPDDVHSIHIDGPGIVVNFHMYGLGLEQLHGRRYYNGREDRWIVFPAHTDIRDARAA